MAIVVMPQVEEGFAVRSDVTVVIPTRNRRVLLLDTIWSVRSQESVDPSVVVVDDGGSDGSGDAVRALRDDKIKFIRNESSTGVSRARNAGLSEVDTTWVAFVDDDDVWAPSKLARQLEELDSESGALWSCVGAVHFDQLIRPFAYFGPPESGDVSSLMLRDNGIPGGGSGVLVATALAREVGGFDPTFSILADWDFYTRLSMRSHVCAVSEPLVGYYFHTDSMMHDPQRFAGELDLLRKKQAETGMSVKASLEYGLWSVRLARMALRLGRWSEAVRFLSRGFNSPTNAASAAREIVRMMRSRIGARRSSEESVDLAKVRWLASFNAR